MSLAYSSTYSQPFFPLGTRGPPLAQKAVHLVRFGDSQYDSRMAQTVTLDESQNEIVGMIRRFTAVLAPVERDSAARDDGLRSDLEYDSLRLIELSYVLEDAFVLEQISTEDALAIETVGDMEDFILGKMRERGYGFENDDPSSARALMSEVGSWLG